MMNVLQYVATRYIWREKTKADIFQIYQDYMQLEYILEDNGGELTPEIEEALTSNREQLQTKAVNYALVIRQIDGEANIIAEEIKRLQAMKKAKDNTVERMKNTIK